MKETIFFLHGNGFPALCYRQLLNNLSKHYDYFYIDKLGHNPNYPVSNNWGKLVSEVIETAQQHHSSPVIAVGHSMGGVLAVMAAMKRPELFKTVILLDSPILNRLKSTIVRFTKKVGLIDRITPALQTKGRKRFWENENEIYHYLKTRPLFQRFAEDCLKDYIQFGLKPLSNGFTLDFDPTIEYQIYRTIPDRLYQPTTSLTLPIGLIYGNQSNIVNDVDINYMKKKFMLLAYETKGTHMFPMEYPLETSEKVKTLIDSLLKKDLEIKPVI